MDNAEERKLFKKSRLPKKIMPGKLFFFRFSWGMPPIFAASSIIPILSKPSAIPAMSMAFPGKFYP